MVKYDFGNPTPFTPDSVMEMLCHDSARAKLIATNDEVSLALTQEALERLSSDGLVAVGKKILDDLKHDPEEEKGDERQAEVTVFDAVTTKLSGRIKSQTALKEGHFKAAGTLIDTYFDALATHDKSNTPEMGAARDIMATGGSMMRIIETFTPKDVRRLGARLADTLHATEKTYPFRGRTSYAQMGRSLQGKFPKIVAPY